MSHHFDTPTAQADPRINVCDFYLFQGAGGTTVMAMTVNPDAGLSAPDTFREEGLYACRFDLNGDGREDVSFKVRFGAVEHADGEEHRHEQNFEVRRAVGPDAPRGIKGEAVVSGRTGAVVAPGGGVKTFAGLAPDLFAGDAAALGAFRNAVIKEDRFAPEAFQNRKNCFAKRNVTAIVLEVPSSTIGAGLVRGWATASLHGHTPEIQVSRWGLPLITNVFMPDAELKEQFNRATPTDDESPFIAQVGMIAEKIATLAGSTTNPREYAGQLTARLFPAMLPYELGTPAAFDFAGFNGRAPTDDVMDVILTLATNTALGDGVAPRRIVRRRRFPISGRHIRRRSRTASSLPGRRPRRSDGAAAMERTTVAVLTVAALAAALAAVAAQGETAPAVLRASFTEDGSVKLPVGYRAWSHIGTRYKPDGTSILDGQPLTVPEILNAYVEPNALAYFKKTGTWADFKKTGTWADFKKTGTWADGTQIVKEMSAIQVGDGCDGTTRICGKSVGTGIFEASYVGLGMMVKDRARFLRHRATGAFSASATSRRPTIQCHPSARRNNARAATSPLRPIPTTSLCVRISGWLVGTGLTSARRRFGAAPERGNCRT